MTSEEIDTFYEFIERYGFSKKQSYEMIVKARQWAEENIDENNMLKGVK